MSRTTQHDTVLEVGTGHGILTEKLCRDAGHVISIESDPIIYERVTSRLGSTPNLTLTHGDGFKTNTTFDVFASNLPYSQSRRAVEWLATKTFRCGAIMVQDEFARKLTRMGTNMRAISVVWQSAFRIVKSLMVNPESFEPPPRVKSVVLAFEKFDTIHQNTIRKLHQLFSQRRKILYRDPYPRRLDDLNASQVIEFVKTIQ